MSCDHAVFRELHSDVETGSELVTAVCARCLRTWSIVDAQHCEKSERPKPTPLFLPGAEATLQLVPIASRQNLPGPASPDPMCGEVGP